MHANVFLSINCQFTFNKRTELQVVYIILSNYPKLHNESKI